MVDKTLGHDLRHQFGRVVLPFAALEAERERQRVGEIIRRRGCQALGGLCHGGMVTAMGERSKNGLRERITRCTTAGSPACGCCAAYHGVKRS